YMLLNIWAQNEDWINNNWYAARPRRPDGKWIFMSWDAEFGIGLIPAGYNSNTFEFIFTRDGYLRDIFQALLKSPIYRAYFAGEADRHAYGALYRTPALARIKRLEDRVKADIPEEAALLGQSSAQWAANMGECRTFVTSRAAPFLNGILKRALYSFPPVTTPRILTCDPAKITNTGNAQVTLSGV